MRRRWTFEESGSIEVLVENYCCHYYHYCDFSGSDGFGKGMKVRPNIWNADRKVLGIFTKGKISLSLLFLFCFGF